MNDYDKAGRYLVKRDPEGVLGWLLGVPDLGFVAWTDARRAVLADQGDLTHDLIAACRHGHAREAYCLELQARSSARTARRVLYGYVPGLMAEGGEPPPDQAGGVVVNFTGRPKADAVRLAPRAAGCRFDAAVRQVTLADAPADALAADAEAGRASAWLLGWLPLMHGGADPGILQAWRRGAMRLRDERDRGILAGLTLTFSTLAKNRPAWERGLEGFNVIKSPYLEELREAVRQDALATGRAEGRVEALREAIARLGGKRFGKPPTKKQRADLDALTDLPRLERIHDHVLTAPSWTELLATP